MGKITEFEVELDTPVNVAVAGQKQECEKVLLRAPSSVNRKEVSRIKRTWTRAMDEVAQRNKANAESKPAEKDDSAKSDDAQITHSEVIDLISATGDDDDRLNKCYDAFEQLLFDGCGSIEGEAITKTIFNRFAYDDLEKLFGEFVMSFLFPSLRD